MTRFSKKTLALAVSALLSANANAVFTIINDGNGPDASYNFASETVVSSTTALKNTNNMFDLTVDLGYEIVKNQEFYIRFDLTNAKFVDDNTDIKLTVTGETAVTPSAGGKDQTFVIYTLKATDLRAAKTDVLLTPNNSVTMDNALKLTSKGPVTVTYGLYQTGSAASSKVPSGRLGSEKSAELLNFNKSGITFKAEQPASADKVKIDVGTESKSFIKDVGNASSKTAQLGKVTVTNTDGVYTPDAKLVGTADTLNLVSGSSKLRIEGDFSATLAGKDDGAKVYLAFDSACTKQIGYLNGISANDQVVVTHADDGSYVDILISNSSSVTTDPYDTATVPTNLGTLAGFYVCMTVTGEHEINGGQYVAKYMPVTADSGKYTVSQSQGNVYKLVRNGAILQTPFFNLVPGYVPRFYLTNTGTNDAPFTIQLITDADATGTLAPGAVTSGTIPKNGAVLLKADEIAAGGQRGAVIFQVLGLDQNINGLFQFRNQATGNFDSIVMPHKAYIYGPPK